MEQSHSTERMYDDLTSANIHISSISWIFLNQLLLEVFSKGEKKDRCNSQRVIKAHMSKTVYF